MGSSVTITWSSTRVQNVAADYSTDGGSRWSSITSTADAGPGQYTWTIPDEISSRCLVRIKDTSNPKVTGQSDATFSIIFQPSIALVSPSGGDSFQGNSAQTISWTSKGVQTVRLQFSKDGGSTFTSIADNVAGSKGSYTWVVPDVESSQCVIKVIGNPDGTYEVSDTSDVKFTILSTAEHYIIIKSPKDEGKFVVGSSYEISWESKGIDNLKLEYSVDGGSTWKLIESSVSATKGSYSWTVPDYQSADCKVRLTSVTDSRFFGTSDGLFEMYIPYISILHNPITSGKENTALTFTATVSGNSAIKDVVVYYDKTGERLFDKTLVMTAANDTTFTAILSPAMFTGHGIEYFITAHDENDLEARYPREGYLSVQAQVTSVKSEVTVTGGSVQSAYRMISVPLTLAGKTIVEQLSGKLPPGQAGTDWRLFRWSPNEDTYKEYPDTGEGLAPGKAFWLIVKEGEYNLKGLTGVTVPTDQSFTISLAPGWNDIGNPWLFPVSWDDVGKPANANISLLYTYEDKWSDPGSIHSIEPWKGYAIRNNENFTVNIILNPNPVGKSARAVAQDTHILWQLSIQASAGEAKDSANHLGVHDDAAIEWDRYDHVEPPVIGEYVSVFFPHRDWKLYPYDYTVDFRPPVPGNRTWDFAVKSNISHETVTVELIGTEQMPERYSLTLVDLDNGHNIDLDNNTFSFVSGKVLTERHFRLLADDSNEPETPQSKPEYIITATCFPNPFNPQTTIRYELPLPGKVSISVYNAVGQLIKVYDAGYQNQGVHERVFAAKQLTSGIYIYYIEAGYSKVTGKMLYMK